MYLCITLENVKNLVEIISILLTGVLSVIGISLLFSYKQKQLDSTFSFLSKLKVRVKNILCIFNQNTYKDHILDALIIPKYQNVNKDFINIRNQITPIFKENVNETLQFLMNSENQFPTVVGWTKNFNEFIEFLETINMCLEAGFYKWHDNNNIEEEQKEFYDKYTKVITLLLLDINEYQTYIENRISKKRNTIRQYIIKKTTFDD